MPSVCDFNTGGDVAGHALRELDSLIRGVLAASMDALAQEDEQQAKKRAEALRAFASMSSTLSPRPRRRSTTKFARRMCDGLQAFHDCSQMQQLMPPNSVS